MAGKHKRGNVDRDGNPTGYGEMLAGMVLTVRGASVGSVEPIQHLVTEWEPK